MMKEDLFAGGEKVLEEQWDVVILGHIAKDTIIIDGESKTAIGGAIYYGGIAGSHMGLKVMVITRLSKVDYPILNDFKKYGVKCLAFPSNETTGIQNIYKSEQMEYRTCKPLDFAGAFKKEEIPDVKTNYFVLGPLLAGEIDMDLLDFIHEKHEGKICLDIQGFVRVRDKEKDEIYFCNISQKKQERILSKLTVLKVDHAEAKALTGKDDIAEAAKDLLDYGTEEILVTHEKGISLFTSDASYFYPWKNKSTKGRTGRGDTAFVSYVGSRITKSPEEALKFATALTSLKLENPGPFTLPLYQVDVLIKKEL